MPNTDDQTGMRLAAISECAPRVHCITNTVAQNFTANMLLAVGAMPSMSLAENEIVEFVTHADALLINLGTLDQQRRMAIDRALEAAIDQGKPWVLDPVLVTASTARRRYALQMLERRPTVVRGNHAEIAVLADGQTDAAQYLAQKYHSVIAQTGIDDFVTDGYRSLTICNGDPMLAHITAMGCACAALLAAFLVVEPEPLQAAGQALLALGVAAELAAEQAQGPGSLQIGVLDQLYSLNTQTLQQRGRIA